MAPWHLWMWPWLGAATGGMAPRAASPEPGAGQDGADRIPWRSPSHLVLETAQFRLRDFSPEPDKAVPEASRPVLIVAPFTLHDAGLADLAPGHSLVEALQAGGCTSLWLLEWKSAGPERRFETIDTQLAALNVAVDEIGGSADIVGLCQGGWLSLLYAARFEGKVSRLVLAGVPVDVEAAPSAITLATQTTPAFAVEQLIESGSGLIEGEGMLRLWPDRPEWPALAQDALQIGSRPSENRKNPALAAFLNWFGRTLDLPGAYYRETLTWLYRENRLAQGRFPALGREVGLASVTCPLVLLAAEDDNIAPPPQVFAAAGLVGTPADAQICLRAGGNHLSLFMGKKTLAREWRRIAGWLSGAGGRPEETKTSPRKRGRVHHRR